MSTSDSIAAATGANGRRTGKTINQIFKATYSNVPVYEYVCRGVAVMRRRSDSYVNATHILKVANFNKPQRTKILESEIQTGHHEKVQGGYGKYQGTWVPLERSIEVARQFGVEEELRPIFDYVPGPESPPPAPKHITAASVRPKKARGASPSVRAIGGAGMNGYDPASLGVSIPASITEGISTDGTDDELMHSLPGGVSPYPHQGLVQGQSARRNSGVMRRAAAVEASNNIVHSLRHPKKVSISPPSSAGAAGSSVADLPPTPSSTTRKRRVRKPKSAVAGLADKKHAGGSGAGESKARKDQAAGGLDGRVRVDIKPAVRPHQAFSNPAANSFDSDDSDEFEDDDYLSVSSAVKNFPTQNYGRAARVLFNYFTSDSTDIPQILLTPPPDFDINQVIDDNGNTPLHWAAATARIRLIQFMVSKYNIDMYRANYAGQTPLARAIQFPDNYNQNAFSSLLDFLQPSVAGIDRNGQSILHHIVITGSYALDASNGEFIESYAVYYMKYTLQRIQSNPMQYGWLIDNPDRHGETPMALARRMGCKYLPRLLLEAGAMDLLEDIIDSEDDDDDRDDDRRAAGYPPRATDAATTTNYLGTLPGHPSGAASSTSPHRNAVGSSDSDNEWADFHSATSEARQTIQAELEKFLAQVQKEHTVKRQSQEEMLLEVQRHTAVAQHEFKTCDRDIVELQDQLKELQTTQVEVDKTQELLMQQMLFNQLLKIKRTMKKDSDADSAAAGEEVPLSPTSRQREVEELHERTSTLEQERQQATKELAVLLGGPRTAAPYHKLIASCCRIPEHEVASMIDAMELS